MHSIKSMQFCLGWHAFPLLLYSFVSFFLFCVGISMKVWVAYHQKRSERAALSVYTDDQAVYSTVYSLC